MFTGCFAGYYHGYNFSGGDLNLGQPLKSISMQAKYAGI